MFTIKGYAKSSPPPRVSGTPTVSGATLTIPFSKRLHPGSVPPPEAFEVVVGDGAGVHPSAVDLDTSRTQRRVTLTLAAPVARGETVEVHYTRPAALGVRLRDFAGNAVASFTQTVANDSLGGRPVADAGADLTVFADSVVTLDGSGSSDPDGDELAYAWTQVSGGSVTLAGADTATPSFAAPESLGELAFRLTVTDPGGLSASDAVMVTVESAALLRQTVKRTLAAVGRGALSSALDNIGMRFLASVPSGQLTLAGKTLALGAGGGRPPRPCARRAV
ncbi:MAG: SwmB domain-containing protein [Gammaproteobacteria bacterium]|nr:SwmB domain-containing protein [Gammaproteobacteria bacterium]